MSQFVIFYVACALGGIGIGIMVPMVATVLFTTMALGIIVSTLMNGHALAVALPVTIMVIAAWSTWATCCFRCQLTGKRTPSISFDYGH